MAKGFENIRGTPDVLQPNRVSCAAGNASHPAARNYHLLT